MASWRAAVSTLLLIAMCTLPSLAAELSAPSAELPAPPAELPAVYPAKVGMSAERLARMSATFQQYVDQGRLAGAVVLVTRRGKVAFYEAYGQRDREASTPMTQDTLFRIASQTKAVVSVGVMVLQEEGRLLIGDPVSKFLPEFANTTVAVPKAGGGYDVVPATRPITVRDLLTHTAGIGYGNGPAAGEWQAAGVQGWYFAHREEPIRETVRRMAALPMDAQPGERFVYGYNTDILGALVEVASGQPLDEFLRDRLFTPLGMTDTQFYLAPEQRSRLAVVYSMQADGSLMRTPNVSAMTGQGGYVDGPRVSFSGGAGLVSTARDYARFLQMLQAGGVLNGRRVLSRKSVELMTVNHLGVVEAPRAGAGFGLGFSVTLDLGASGEPGSVGSYGWGGAYHTAYWVDPVEELVVVYMTQVIPAVGLDDAGKLRALVYQSIVD